MSNRLFWSEAEGLPKLEMLGSVNDRVINGVWQTWQEELDDTARAAHLHGGAMLSLDDLHPETIGSETLQESSWGFGGIDNDGWPMAG